MPTTDPATPRPPRDDEHVLVVGCGYVGLPAAARLAATGRRVTGVRRRDVPAPAPGVRMVAADVLDDADLARLPRDADVVVVALSPGGRDVERYRQAYLEAPRRVVDHLDAPPRLVLLTTSTAVYGQDDGSWVDEDAPTEPTSPTARVLVEAEQALAGLGADHAIGLRLGGIYGPGRERLLRQVAAGEAECVEGAWTNRIHRDDAADAIRHLVQTPSVLDRALNVVDDTPALRCEVLRWLAQRLGAPPPVVRPPDPENGGRSGTSKRVSNARLRATGWRPGHSAYVDGYGALSAQA